MPVKNVTRNTIIASRSRIADSVVKRAVGLMFSKPTEAAMILKFPKDTPISLHTYFVFFPIDILFIDSRLRVVELVQAMQPFTTYSSRSRASYVVELPSGTIRKTRTKPGDEIAFLRIVERKLENGRSITVSRVQQ
ncbi:DUF192 domain-containing protein [Candidatus Woesearchaeota archaeon]|nr:DUF192 domain-containing protein [Candidatus Woesearchaeota archaeon]